MSLLAVHNTNHFTNIRKYVFQWSSSYVIPYESGNVQLLSQAELYRLGYQ